MILTKDYEAFSNDYDFKDSIVSGVSWDSNLIDLLVTVDYYWDIQKGRKNTRVLTVRFKNCRKAIFAIPHFFDSIGKTENNELNAYIFSWFTITRFIVKRKNGLIDARIKTADKNPLWLTVTCGEVWLEGPE